MGPSGLYSLADSLPGSSLQWSQFKFQMKSTSQPRSMNYVKNVWNLPFLRWARLKNGRGSIWQYSQTCPLHYVHHDAINGRVMPTMTVQGSGSEWTVFTQWQVCPQLDERYRCHSLNCNPFALQTLCASQLMGYLQTICPPIDANSKAQYRCY